MSRAAAKAFYDQQSGDPASGYITPADAQASLDVVYDDMAALPYAPAATVGNLLTPNQASGTDTLSDTTGFAAQPGGGTLTSVSDAFGSGSRSLKCAVTGAAFQGVLIQSAPAFKGVAMTVYAKVRVTTTGTYRFGAYSVAAGVNTLTEVTITAGSWVTLQHTFTPTANTNDIDLLIDTSYGGGVTGDIYIDEVSLHRGAGGQWAMPGVPITGTGTRVLNGKIGVWDPATGKWWEVAGVQAAAAPPPDPTAAP